MTRGGKRTPSPGKRLGRPPGDPKENTVKISISLDPIIFDKLETKAKAEDKSRTRIIEEALKAYFS
jgi:hypothetical protein